MKKFKLFIISVISALCLCFAFTGCAEKGAEYSEDSFNYNVKYNADFVYYYVDYSFVVDIHKDGEYTVYHYLTAKDVDGNELKSTEDTYSFRTTKNKVSVNNQSVRFYAYKEIDEDSVSLHVKIYAVDEKRDFTDYAIGFGVVGAVFTIGLVVLFVLDKKGIIGKKK